MEHCETDEGVLRASLWGSTDGIIVGFMAGYRLLAGQARPPYGHFFSSLSLFLGHDSPILVPRERRGKIGGSVLDFLDFML